MELLLVGLNGGFQSTIDYRRDTDLHNTLFHRLYPQGHLACLSLRSLMPSAIPVVLDEVLSGIRWQGISYMPVGSQQSIKRQEIYLVDESTYLAIADRFRRCSETLIAQFDLLVSSCDSVSDQELTVSLVPTSAMGVNDWQGWIRRSVFSKLGIADVGSHYPFAMGFGEMQAKGEFAVMEDAIADRHRADIIIPKKCLKPLPKRLGYDKFVGPVLLGIKKSCPDQAVSDGLNNLLTQHVCGSGCDSSGSLRHIILRTFNVREMHAVQTAGK